MNRPKIDDAATFLQDNGLLFEINRQVLHPLGLELHFQPADGDGVTLDLYDNRAVPDPIFFTPEAFEAGREKYEAYMADHGRRNIQKRRQIGMVIQTGSALPYHVRARHDRPGDRPATNSVVEEARTREAESQEPPPGAGGGAEGGAEETD